MVQKILLGDNYNVDVFYSKEFIQILSNMNVISSSIVLTYFVLLIPCVCSIYIFELCLWDMKLDYWIINFQQTEFQNMKRIRVM